MIRIPLADGLCALIDDADEQLVSGFYWRPLRHRKTTYVHAWHHRLHVYMHRLVVGAPDGLSVDHVNRNGLDNRRANLRLATNSQNHANRLSDQRQRGTTSDFKGVFFDRARQRWMATIHIEGKTRSLGRYETEVAAAIAYNRAAIETWGRFARTNIIPGTEWA